MVTARAQPKRCLRRLGEVSCKHFKTAAFNRSATSPQWTLALFYDVLAASTVLSSLPSVVLVAVWLQSVREAAL
jgi:hypothetical protein